MPRLARTALGFDGRAFAAGQKISGQGGRTVNSGQEWYDRALQAGG
jgi:hypothetical protein